MSGKGAKIARPTKRRGSGKPQLSLKRRKIDEAFRANFERLGVSAKPRGGLANDPWKTFNPEKRCRVHDELNDKMIEWLPRWATLYQEYADKR
jgi:hypothetical protein